MTCGIDGADAGRDLVARFDEAGSLGERNRDLDEQLAIKLARLANVLAAFPEIELGGAENVARIGIDRLAAVDQAADMIRMAVGDHDHVDILGLVAGLRQAFGEMAIGYAVAQLFVVAAQSSVAGVEEDDFTAGIHHRRDEWMLVAARVDAVVASQCMHGFGRVLGAERRVQAFTHDLAVEDAGDLEAAERETIDARLQRALLGGGHVILPIFRSGTNTSNTMVARARENCRNRA